LGFQVHFARSGKSVSTDGEPVFSIWPSERREIDYGADRVLRACRIKLSRGEVQMSDNDLPGEERAAGYIYACAAKPYRCRGRRLTERGLALARKGR
jgi:hypothetical protein